MIRLPQRLPDPNAVWFDTRTGRPSREYFQYMREADQAMRELIAMSTPIAFSALPTGSEGQLAFVSNGRKAGQGAGAGTGVLAFHDGTTWIAVDTGAAVAA